MWRPESAFCQAVPDPLCSSTGVWSSPRQAHSTTGCPVYGNIGAAAVYNEGPARPHDPLDVVPARKSVDVRYVTHDRAWVLGKVTGETLGPQRVHWGFFPRSCLAAGRP